MVATVNRDLIIFLFDYVVTRKTKKEKKEMRVEPDHFPECSVYQLQEWKRARMQLNENTKQKDKKKL